MLVKEFEGEIPQINITKSKGNIYYFYCSEYALLLRSAVNCSLFFKRNKCKNCILTNYKFIKLWAFNGKCCKCGNKLDLGYFLLIYLLEKAGILRKNFKMICCTCKIEN